MSLDDSRSEVVALEYEVDSLHSNVDALSAELARIQSIDAHLVDYATSGDVSGDRSAVVGYAGICIHA